MSSRSRRIPPLSGVVPSHGKLKTGTPSSILKAAKVQVKVFALF